LKSGIILLTGLKLINIYTISNNYKSVKTRIKTIVKDVRSPAGEISDEDMSAKISTVQSAFDKASKKGVIHKRTAARKVSRLTKLKNSASS
jgi:small subunit ribosomal protein S20